MGVRAGPGHRRTGRRDRRLVSHRRLELELALCEPAVEVPYDDFFCNGWGVFAQVNSQTIAANPHGGFNSYWPTMPPRAPRD
ncbi:DUF2961 domain-containing protein [Agromyces cerinus subsp. nitratus]|uniref:DUF2961 domain-containing protein n=1 Tax=Agromyces cerinus TaxID=33878 RepID=UPI001EF94316|nr:DUF2961 domain-containing protein [Agromyces cerinus]